MIPELEILEINDKFPEPFKVFCAEITSEKFHEIPFIRNYNESMNAT